MPKPQKLLKPLDTLALRRRLRDRLTWMPPETGWRVGADRVPSGWEVTGGSMAGRQPGFWDVEERLRELSAQGDPLEKLAGTVDFEMFRPDLDLALGDVIGPGAAGQASMRF